MKRGLQFLLLPSLILVVLHGTLASANEWEFMQYLLASQLIVVTAILFYHRQQNSSEIGFSLRKKYIWVIVPLVLIALVGMGVEFERGQGTIWDRPIRDFVSAESDWIISTTMVGAALISILGLFVDRRNS
ncbi:MAG: hypothetical protein K2X47_06450 [Bdellovibrionales bacterium]|nr:hypothetical protein [Bdellovibrionales bacterium]